VVIKPPFPSFLATEPNGWGGDIPPFQNKFGGFGKQSFCACPVLAPASDPDFVNLKHRFEAGSADAGEDRQIRCMVTETLGPFLMV
jgi:hypothetical protein